MTEIIELFKEVDLNNIPWMLLVSIVLIVVFASCIGPFFASHIEKILMSKEDDLKRLSLAYIILFCFLLIINYVFISETLCVLICMLLVILSVFIYGLLWILNLFDKFKSVFYSYSDTGVLLMIITFFPVVSYGVSNKTDIKLASCVVLCALAEIIIIALTLLHPTYKESSIFIKMDKEKWYVFRRMDSNYLLCGDKKNISEATKLKLLDLNAIVKNDIYFEKDNSKSK